MSSLPSFFLPGDLLSGEESYLSILSLALCFVWFTSDCFFYEFDSTPKSKLLFFLVFACDVDELWPPLN